MKRCAALAGASVAVLHIDTLANLADALAVYALVQIGRLVF